MAYNPSLQTDIVLNALLAKDTKEHLICATIYV